MDQLDRRLILGAAGLAGVAAISRLAKGGPIDPPAGPVVPTGKTVQQIYDKIARTDAGLAEPRIPVQSLPGSASALHVITQPGSYYLTGNIQGEAGKNGIEIAGDGISIDLSGFGLIGAPGTLAGLVCSATRRGLRLHNGAFQGWTGGAVNAGSVQSGVYRNLSITGCSGAFAIFSPGAFAVVADIAATFCDGNVAIGLGREGQILNCAAMGNTGDGIGAIDAGHLVQSCLAKDNGGSGFAVSRALVLDCLSIGNAGAYRSFVNSVIERCCAVQCGSGFVIEGANTIKGCSAVNCSVGFRVQEFAHNMLDDCEAKSCQIGFDIQASPNNFVRNRTLNCPSPYLFAPSNSHGPIVNASGIGDISTVANSNHPLANFIY